MRKLFLLRNQIATIDIDGTVVRAQVDNIEIDYGYQEQAVMNLSLTKIEEDKTMYEKTNAPMPCVDTSSVPGKPQSICDVIADCVPLARGCIQSINGLNATLSCSSGPVGTTKEPECTMEALEMLRQDLRTLAELIQLTRSIVEGER